MIKFIRYVTLAANFLSVFAGANDFSLFTFAARDTMMYINVYFHLFMSALDHRSRSIENVRVCLRLCEDIFFYSDPPPCFRFFLAAFHVYLYWSIHQVRPDIFCFPSHKTLTIFSLPSSFIQRPSCWRVSENKCSKYCNVPEFNNARWALSWHST